MDFLVGAIVVAALVWGAMWFKDQRTDRALDLAFIAIEAEARAKLSPDDIERLTQALQEILAITREQIVAGVPAKQARRMGKRAAIQAIASAIEIDRMFSSKAA